MDEKFLARFWAKVNKDGPVPAHCPEIGQCWLWSGAKRGRYGCVWVLLTRRYEYPHRVVLLIRNGHWPECALHRCDNTMCVRPEHLFEGTQRENVADMHTKKRAGFGVLRGSRNGCSKLTEDNVLEIRAARTAGEPLQSLATRFGVTKQTVWAIVHRKKWISV